MTDRFRLDEIRDLFRDDVARLLLTMHEAATRVRDPATSQEALDELRHAGHALKGSAGLVGLTYLSQAGAAIEALASDARKNKPNDPLGLGQWATELASALPLIERMLEDALAGADPETQENLYTEFTLCFAEHRRNLLHELDLTPAADAPMRSASAASQSAPSSNEDDEAWLAELQEAFQEELRENLDRVPGLIAQLEDPAQRKQAFYDLSRVFHTIKGSAAMVGRSELSDLARYLQDAFGEAAETGELPADSGAVVQSSLRAIFAAADLALPTFGSALQTPVTPVTAPPAAMREVDPELLEAFTLDADEALEASERLLLQLERQPDDRNILQSLFRRFHTLKGAAAAVGLDSIADQLHQGESLLEAVLQGTIRVDSTRLVDLLFRLTDSVKILTQRAKGVPVPGATSVDVTAEIAALAGELSKPAERDATLSGTGASEAQLGSTAEPAPEAEWESGTVRIQASRLDALMSQVTQLVVSRTRMERKIETFAELRDKLDYCRRRLTDLIQGFQEHYEYTIGERKPATASPAALSAATNTEEFFTDLEFDKYDDVNILARSVIELATDTGEIADQLGTLIDSFSDDSRQFSKITSSLQRQITRLRMVPLDSVFRRLARPVRTAARQAGKIVDLVLEGGDVQLDKAIVEALHAPLLHLVRNAVSHGIEPPAERQARGKATAGTIRISAQPRHNSVAIEVADDGRGINYDAILAKGRSLGLIPAGATPSREQLLSLIFQPGFSTGEEVTDLSGRGVGMDVVARDIAALNGSLQVESRDYEGTTIRLLLPLSTSIDEVLMLHVGEQTYAIGADYVEQAVAVQRDRIVSMDGQAMLQVRNELVPLLFLAGLVGQPPPAETATGLLLRSADKLLALVVDRVEPQREVVLQPLGPLLEHHPFLSSATISGDGTVIFTLHVAHLFDILQASGAHPSTFILDAKAEEQEIRPEAILVVDDSISVRKMTSRFLESEGWEVDTAVDGLDALDKLAKGRFRLVITDLEMPRMHGYELIAEIRRQPALQHLPIIVCSSRSSDKHRSRAAEVGAQGYLTKPFTKEQLVEEMVRVAGRDILPAHLAVE